MNKTRKIEIIKAIITFLLFYLRKYLTLIPVYLFKIDVNKVTNTDTALVNLFLNLLLVILLFLLYRKELKQEFKKFKQHFKEDFDTGLRYWLAGLAIMIITNVLITLFTPLKNSTNEISVQSLINVAPFLMFITAGILAPIVEEMTFRKAIHGIFKNKWVFCFISGFIFGLLHVLGNASSWYEYLYVISYGGLGFFFAYAYQETDTIFTSISMHMLHNSLLVLLAIL